MVKQIGFWLRWFRDYLYFSFDLFSGRRTKAELETCAQIKKDCGNYLDFSYPLKMLDLGSGHLQPLISIFKAQGHHVFGVDLAYGNKFTIKELIYWFARIIFKLYLPIRKACCLNPDKLRANVGSLPFKDNSFDLIISMAAFEHFLDVPMAIKEIFRVLRPGGIAWISIHNFCSLSGGHNIGRQLSDIKSLPFLTDPWDHLRKQALPFTVPLNKWRANQYKDEFAKSFKIHKFTLQKPEGESFLSSEVKKSLDNYSYEELVNSQIILCCEK